MPSPELIRPEISDDVKAELSGYLNELWDKAYSSRTTQVDTHYTRWDALYNAIPKEKIRKLPWPNSSNIVIPITRMYVDTFVARTLNIIFATRPTYTTLDLSGDQKEAYEYYINLKANTTWRHYELARDILFRGNKTGTAIIKTPWVEDKVWSVTSDSESGGLSTNELTTYLGPKSHCIPFEDFFLYPITVNHLNEAKVRFHRMRKSMEDVKALIDSGKWSLATFEDIEAHSRSSLSENIKQERQQTEAGIELRETDDFEYVEANFTYPIMGTSYQLFDLYVCFVPKTNIILDVYYNPFPNNLDIYADYRPFPQEDLFFGTSQCEILGPFQEEISSIHNDRRNNSYLSNAPVFKRKVGALVPNPASAWYPGKVFDVQNMDDFDIMAVGRNYTDMLQEENHSLQLIERLTGVGAVQQGYAAGMMGKRGIYNAQGTMAILQETNQRQSTNIRDARKALGRVMSASAVLQAAFDPADLTYLMMPEELQAPFKEAVKTIQSRKDRVRFDVAASDAGANQEVRRQNLLMLSGVLEKYGGLLAQLAPPLMQPNVQPGVRDLFNQILEMHQWMAKRVMRAFQEEETEGVVPNALRSIELQVPGSSTSQAGASAPGLSTMEAGGAADSEEALDLEGLQRILETPRLPA